MQLAIIYKSKYGATRQYAHWLAEALQWPLCTTPGEAEGQLANCDCLLIGSPVYFGKLLIADWLHKNQFHLQHKKLFLFIVCATPETEAEKRQQILFDSIPTLLYNRITPVFLPGRLQFDQLSFWHKLTLKVATLFEKDPVQKKIMIENVDEVKQYRLQPLVEQVNQFLGKSLTRPIPA